MCVDIPVGCHSIELWMPVSDLILVTVGFVFLFLFIRFLARSTPGLGI